MNNTYTYSSFSSSSLNPGDYELPTTQPGRPPPRSLDEMLGLRVPRPEGEEYLDVPGSGGRMTGFLHSYGGSGGGGGGGGSSLENTGAGTSRRRRSEGGIRSDEKGQQRTQRYSSLLDIDGGAGSSSRGTSARQNYSMSTSTPSSPSSGYQYDSRQQHQRIALDDWDDHDHDPYGNSAGNIEEDEYLPTYAEAMRDVNPPLAAAPGRPLQLSQPPPPSPQRAVVPSLSPSPSRTRPQIQPQLLPQLQPQPQSQPQLQLQLQPQSQPPAIPTSIQPSTPRRLHRPRPHPHSRRSSYPPPIPRPEGTPLELVTDRFGNRRREIVWRGPDPTRWAGLGLGMGKGLEGGQRRK